MCPSRHKKPTDPSRNTHLVYRDVAFLCGSKLGPVPPAPDFVNVCQNLTGQVKKTEEFSSHSGGDSDVFCGVLTGPHKKAGKRVRRQGPSLSLPQSITELGCYQGFPVWKSPRRQKTYKKGRVYYPGPQLGAY